MFEPYAVEEWQHRGLTVKLYGDVEPMSPAEWETLGEIVLSPKHARQGYSFGRAMTGTEADALERGGMALVIRYLRFIGSEAVPIVFQDYGSSGARLFEDTSPDAESGEGDGFIVTDRKRAEYLGCEWEPSAIRDSLRSEVKEWGQFLEGDVYGAVVCAPGTDETLESVWSLYGLDYAKETAREIADAIADNRAELAKEARVRMLSFFSAEFAS